MAASGPPGPDRFTAITVEYTSHTWWMAKWRNNSAVCSIVVDHEGTPTGDEIFDECGEDIYDEWIVQESCPEYTIRTKPQTCDGFYLYEISSEPAEHEIAVKLPPPVVLVSLEGCTDLTITSTNLCEEPPVLILTGQEPLPNENIISIEGLIDGEEFSCGSDECRFDLPITPEEGISIDFWAFSSYGDSSEAFQAQVRVAEAETENPDESAWYVDVLSTQWTGQPLATCAESWETFPPVGGPPPWLTTPKRTEDLTSNIPYSYLASNLILQGFVDASSCPNWGLLPEGGADACGLEVARPAVDEWQNRFDEEIMSVAQNTSIPAQLLKNLFARESQFWPGIFQTTTESGLGQMTDGGADITLLWNPSFYNQFCPLVLSSETCDEGYLHLDEENQVLLRAALVQNVNAYCEDCPYGLDLSQANFSISVFAHTLLASCEQTGRIVRNVTGKAPGKTATFEDMWKLTLVNYNAGPGCLSSAVEDTWVNEQDVSFDRISAHLEGICMGAIDYVNDIDQ
jgi:hypothetical protein